MPEAGTLCILGEPHGYHVRYASNNAQSPERRPVTCPDEAALAAVLHACGLDPWSIDQACAELQAGRVAIVSLVCTRTHLDATFPLAPPSALSHSPRMSTRQAIRARFLPHGAR
jgi:hypothetical protein